MINAIILATLISSCSMHTTVDQRSVLGLYLPAKSHHMCLDFGYINLLYVEMQACTKLTAPGPTIIYAPFESVIPGGYAPLSTVMVNINYQPRNDARFLRQAFVRHLLYKNGRDPDDPELYIKCANPKAN